MTDEQGKIKLKKFPTTLGEGYRAGDTFYLYLRRPVKELAEYLRRALEDETLPNLHDHTESLRQWAHENNIPVPKDTDDLCNYVLTAQGSEPPTLWPPRAYMRTHQTLSPTTMEKYIPKVIYPWGTSTMCRFGHPRPVTPNGKKECYKCAYWREQGINLLMYRPTHCVKGHPLKDNRWLAERRGKVSEHCVQCNNDKIINESGYKPSN